MSPSSHFLPGDRIVNDFWALGPNVTGYPGGFPNGFLQRLRGSPWWGARRLYVCSGSVHDGVTVDLERKVRPTVVADAEWLPFASHSFDLVIADPPYSEELASTLYGTSYLSVPRLLKEAARVLVPGGHVALLDWRVWPPPPPLMWRALIAVYNANRGPKPLRALQVYRNGPDAKRGRLDDWRSIEETKEVAGVA